MNEKNLEIILESLAEVINNLRNEVLIKEYENERLKKENEELRRKNNA